ncbi:efflux RND transporter permease subunit [Paenibacillus alba]|uniref:Efflux RND transporter permease subunit n=1 Tax=Paenibacillus alba TaxID=1197127 RepID=A0ABU6G4X9_9BACL|nr:efflux RND transporter permease subunit [Paenibacillus alba]MEC0229232.1 efflux RND transporter permease subunit [Paenibacillus alba]NQX66285.1 efflux RND transporter permease subunit [Paenibacillus alba]
MKLANFSVHRPVTILMIMIALVIVGSIAVPLLPVDLYPNLEIPSATVSVSWSGASPGQIEQQITKPIENAMATVTGVTSISSNSRTGSSNVTLQFNYGTNIDQATLTMRDKLDRVRRQLPSDADAPVVSRVDPNSTPIMTLALYGKTDLVTLRDIADNIVSPDVQRSDGVASVGVTGGRVRQIQILVEPSRLQQYNISFSTLVSALGNDNSSTDAGLVNKGSQLVPLHIDGDFKSIADIGKVQVQLGRGQTIALSELGKIIDTYQDVTLEARKDGEASVSLSVLKQSDGNTVSVSSNIQQSLQEIQSKLPEGMHIAVLNDSAKFIRDSLRTVVEHTLLGGVFSVIILLFFLRSVRATLIIGVVIPISIISTFSMMYFSHQTINTITLGGLALGLGSLVDFAVVVLESIFRKRHEGLSPEEAAKVGTAEVGTAVMASALAQIAVFAPTAFISGLVKQFFWPMALVVCFSHIAAWFAAVTLVPMLAAKILRKKVDEELPAGRSFNPLIWFGRGMERVTGVYGRLLKWSMLHRWVIISITVILFAGSVYSVRFVGSELTPKTDQGQVNLNINLPQGTDFAVTNQVATTLETRLKDVPEIDSVFTSVGSAGGGAFQSSATNTGSIQIRLKPLSERKKTTDQVAEQIRTLTTGFAGAQIGVSVPAGVRLPGIGGGGNFGGGDIQVNLSGPDLAVLQKLGDLVAQEITSVDGTRNVQNTLDRSIPQFNLTIDRDAAAHYGVSLRDVMSALRTAYQGSVATQFKTASSQISVLVKYPNDFTNKLENFNNVTINTAGGTVVPVSLIAKVEPGTGPAQIRRQDQNRVATVQASVFGASVGEVSALVKQKIDAIQPPDGYQVTLGGQQTSQNDSFKSLYLVLLLSIALVYMVMASQFESLYGPFIIMFSLPPTFVGAILGLLVTHRTINMNSIIGMIMLIGIVVNNAIVLIDYTNQLRAKGMPLFDALLEAGKIRLRPILMTTATTVLAMLPLVIGFGDGAETQASMATVVAFGLTLSTLITLVLVPVVYTLLDGWKDGIARRFKRKPAALQEQTSTTSV